MPNTGDAITEVYSKRSELIILGLTGRTGSGCSKVAKILATRVFSKLDLPIPQSREFSSVEERKYKIIYDYMRNDNRWIPFETIEISSIILTFVLEQGMKQFLDHLHTLRSGINGERLILPKDIGELRQIEYMFVDMQKNILPERIDFKEIGETRTSELLSFYFETINVYKEKFKTLINQFDCYEISSEENNIIIKRKCSPYARLMQYFGNNIRSSSDPYNSTFDGKLPSELILRVEKLISLKLACNKEAGRKTRICIDAIRNPFEAYYLRDRYRPFYLLSINTDDDTRRKRLEDLTKIELDILDAIEYPKKLKRQDEIFSHQDIRGCLEASDIHIYNPEAQGDKFFLLTQQLLKYLALSLHPGLITPTPIERCMQLAYNAKLNSGCLSRQVGAIVTDKYYSTKGIGWNDVPKGHVACNLRDLRSYCINRSVDTYSKFEICNKDFSTTAERIVEKANGNGYMYRLPFCFKDIYNGIEEDKNQVHTRSLHAEENAFLQIAKYGGQGLQGGCLFTTASPCELCAKKAYQLEIRQIFYIDPYPGISSEHILSFGNGTQPEMHLFYGAIGNAYISLYSQRMAYKDELALLTGINFRTESEANRKNNKQKKEEFRDINDIEYLSYSVEFMFQKREEVACIRDSKVKFLANGKRKIEKTLYWTGSSYGHTEMLEPKSNLSLTETVNEDKVIYTIDLGREMEMGDEEQFKIISYVFDKDHLMEPYLAHIVNNRTRMLKLSVSFPGNIIADPEIAIYTDKSREHLVSKEVVAIQNIGENRFRIEVNFEKPNLFYMYALKWKFGEDIASEIT